MKTHISAQELNIRLAADDESALFKWLIASFLMGKRIQAEIAVDAYRVIVEHHQRDSARKLSHCSHRDLVSMLGEARYTRYDESTADRLLRLSKRLSDEYAGKVSNMVLASDSREAFETRLLAFEGVGPKTVEIFMRDAACVLF